MLIAVLMIDAAASSSLTSAKQAIASPPAARISVTTSSAGVLDEPLPSISHAVVGDDDASAPLGEQQRVRPSDASTGTGDDDDLAVESQLVWHVSSSASPGPLDRLFGS